MQYEAIKEQFSKVIEYSQGIYEPNLEDLFNRWEKAKSKFIKRFGGLIFEWPEQITFTLDDKEKRKSVMEFSDLVCNVYHNDKLANFIDDNIDTFYDNIVQNSNLKEVPRGMKLIKAFKYFEENEICLHTIQDLASQLIQENKITGKLCFSVHPLDFLSSSCNSYNWRSCHSLDGEFRAGNLSYMVDETTFMVYLKGEDKVTLPCFPNSVPWNSKKWRVLIHASTDDELMFAGRQYPFQSQSGMDIVLNIYNNFMANEATDYYSKVSSKYYNWKNDYVTTDPQGSELAYKYFYFHKTLLPLEEVVTYGMGSLNYNDVLNSTCYTKPYYTILNPCIWHDSKRRVANPIVVGNYVTCLHCGEDDIQISETMRCPDCEAKYGFEENDNYTHCDCCGARVHVSEANYVDDETYCDACCDQYAFICDHCGELTSTMDKHFIPGEKDGEEMFMCHYCYDEYMTWKEKEENG